MFIIIFNSMYRSAGLASEGRVVQCSPSNSLGTYGLPCTNSAWYEKCTNSLSSYHLKKYRIAFPSLLAFLDRDNGRVTDNGVPKVDCPVVVAKEAEDWLSFPVATSHHPCGPSFCRAA